MRDYIHVCDLIDAHVLGLEYLKRVEQTKFLILVLKSFSVNEIINKVQDITKTEIRKIILLGGQVTARGWFLVLN